MNFSVALTFALLSSPLLAQNTQFSSDLHQASSAINWNITSSAGTVNVSPSTFHLGGSLDFKLDSAAAPFTSGLLNGALTFTDPAVLHGEIANPLPFLPPLAELDLKNLEFALSAPSFAIDPITGDFTADVTLVVTNGTSVMTGLLGNSNESVAGLVTTPTALSGNVSQSGNIISMWLDVNMQIHMVDPATGITSTVTLVGDIYNHVLTSDADSMHLSVPYGLTPGATNNLSFSNATPSSPVFLAGSGYGRGAFSVPSLGVTLGMHNPQHVATTTANSAGSGVFNVFVPASLSGVSVLVQCVQNSNISNVAGTFIE